MGFDKSKAMRNAEKFLAQGKIKAAIGEYKQVVENDPRDYGTMNLLGDLSIKASDPKSALRFYFTVAEYYSAQGFAQKAIAVYNKISKIQPNSVAVSEKLAELYKTKGSFSEAKSHYVLLAENYQAKGRIVEALAMWKQIALLDPSNTDVYLTIADAYLKEGQSDDAAEALADAGDRFVSRGRFAEAEAAYLRGLEVIATHPRSLAGYVNTQIGLGNASAAAEKLESILAEHGNNRDVLYTLVDCYIEAGEKDKAERSVIKLVEQEPANYPKFLDLANSYLIAQEFDGASRMLTMASEHMLAGGQAEEFASAVRHILDHQPENLDAVRLLVRFSTWQRDDEALKDSLRMLAELAKQHESVDDERFALSQLVMFLPQEIAFAERLHEINELHGFVDDAPVTHKMFDERFIRTVEPTGPTEEVASEAGFAFVEAVIESTNGDLHEAQIHHSGLDGVQSNLTDAEVVVDDSPEGKRRREVESIKFYVDSGYTELAEKAVEEFSVEYGDVPEVAELRAYLRGSNTPGPDPAAESGGRLFDIGEFRNELGLEDPVASGDQDFETKYQTATAYHEMGLLEPAIAEFQEAASLVRPNDGTRRFFSCANLLGYCFMQQGMPKLALMWYERALEISDLTTDEKLALWFELGVVYEADGDYDRAGKYFEQVYAENVDFRDVRERLKNMAVAA